MRTVKQPGIGPAERIQWVEARGTPVAEGSRSRTAAPRSRPANLCGARVCQRVLRLEGGAFGPFAYVMPALSETPRTPRSTAPHGGRPAEPRPRRRPDVGAPRRCAVLPLPRALDRGGRHPARRPRPAGGNLRRPTDPDRRHRTRRRGLRDGSGSGDGIHALRPGPAPRRRQRGRKTRVRAEAPAEPGPLGFLEAFAASGTSRRPNCYGGVGSIIGASYRDGRRVDAFATEMAIRSGRISRRRRREPEAVLDVALVDYTGAVSEGRLVRGDNPVLMTVEAVLEAGG